MTMLQVSLNPRAFVRAASKVAEVSVTTTDTAIPSESLLRQ